jgi:hypothetical protein
MTRGPSPIPQITLGHILHSKQTIHSTFSTLLVRSRDAILRLGLAVRFAGWTYQAVETLRLNHAFMNIGSAERSPRTANILASATLITIEVGSPC